MSSATQHPGLAEVDPGVVAGRYAPAFRPGLVRRPRLVARLKGSGDAPLILLVAPAGYGKTTVLTEWAQEDDRPFAWITLSPADNDPARLLASIVEALERIEPVSPDVLEALSAPKPSISGVVLPRIGRSLVDRGPFVLVLDDVHVLRGGESLDLLIGIGERLPTGAQLALASRTQPRLPLGRLRAHRRLDELHQDDLAMTLSEGSELLEAMGLRLDPADAKTLVRHVEGWPAGLYLAGVALTHQPDPREAVAQFAGDDRILVDYMRDEFLSKASPGAREFLTRTSVLEVLSGSLCDAILGTSGTARTLRDLARDNMLIVSLDRRDESYRYHALFAEMLRSELHRLEPEIEPELHRRAMAWHTERGALESAISHAIASGDVVAAGDLIWVSLPEYTTSGRNATLQGWLDRFSDEQIASYPPLALAAAGAWLTSGDGERAERWTSVAAAGLERTSPEQGEALDANVAIYRAVLAREGVARMSVDAIRGAAGLPEDSPWRSVCCLAEGVAAHLSGDAERARRKLNEGARRGAAAARNVEALCLAQLSLLESDQGNAEEASWLATTARAQVERSGLGDYESSALVFGVLALDCARRGQVRQSRSDAQRSMRLLELLTAFPPWYEAETRLVLARAALRLDEVADSRRLLDEASRFVRRTPDAVTLRKWLEEARTALDAASAALAGMGRWGLTPAELRLLQFLPTHRTFREIAHELYVSANTVKTQARAVYRKLDATSRTEAVERARLAGLLDSEPRDTEAAP